MRCRNVRFVLCCCILDFFVCPIFLDYDWKLILLFSILALENEYRFALNKFIAMAERHLNTLDAMPTYGQDALKKAAKFVFAMTQVRRASLKYEKLAAFQINFSNDATIIRKLY